MRITRTLTGGGTAADRSSGLLDLHQDLATEVVEIQGAAVVRKLLLLVLDAEKRVTTSRARNVGLRRGDCRHASPNRAAEIRFPEVMSTYAGTDLLGQSVTLWAESILIY